MQKTKKTNKQNKILSVVKEMLASQTSTKNKWHKMGYSLRSTEEVQVHTVKAATPNLFPLSICKCGLDWQATVTPEP